MADGARPQHVGILAAEVYFPCTCVSQEDLEQHDGVPAGKYVTGLGQQAVAFCGDREDAISMAATALRQLMDRHGVAPADIGRLEVGTESAMDSSKSIKSHLMAVLQAEDPGAADVEGCDCVHACYGATAAVLNAANWVEGAGWDGRYAVVVASDTAVYAPGPARATSGAGAVALLIGPDAPLALERGLVATHFTDATDFFKPFGLFPILDGPLSVASYLEALDATYERFGAKFAARHGRGFTLEEADHVLFHSPYNKLVQKAFARLAYLDMCRSRRKSSDVAEQNHQPNGHAASSAAGGVDAAGEGGGAAEGAAPPSPPLVIPLGEGAHPLPPGRVPRELEKALLAHSNAEYERKVGPSACVGRLCGNMYTASLWAGVGQVVETTGAALEGRRLLLFSYGSGAAGTLLSVVGRRVEGRFNLDRLQAMSDLAMRLVRRSLRPPAEFERAVALAERRYGAAAYLPEQAVEELAPGSYYLEEVDDKHRRRYSRKPPAAAPQF